MVDRVGTDMCRPSPFVHSDTAMKRVSHNHGRSRLHTAANGFKALAWHEANHMYFDGVVVSVNVMAAPTESIHR